MKSTLTKDAKNLAILLFQHTTRITFGRPAIIHPRSRKALDNLVANGYLKKTSHREIGRGAEGFDRTDKMDKFKGLDLPNEKGLLPFNHGIRAIRKMSNVIQLYPAPLSGEEMLKNISENKPESAFVICWNPDGQVSFHTNETSAKEVLFRLQSFIHDFYSGKLEW